jgi:hypothetical protein
MDLKSNDSDCDIFFKRNKSIEKVSKEKDIEKINKINININTNNEKN